MAEPSRTRPNCIRTAFEPQSRRPDAGKRHGFRSWFDSSQARQTVRWGRFRGLLFAPVFAVKPGGPHSRPGFGASASQARPGAQKRKRGADSVWFGSFFREHISGSTFRPPENAPIARFDGLVCYGKSSESSPPQAGKAGDSERGPAASAGALADCGRFLQGRFAKPVHRVFAAVFFAFFCFSAS